MIGIVDYGLGNVLAVESIYRKLDVPVEIISDASQFADVRAIIMPGVGAFDWAMRKLDRSGLRSAMTNAVFERALPVLGICVGMQMLASSSDEGRCAGLGWINGNVRLINKLPEAVNVALPHMGWNEVMLRREHPLFDGLDCESRFYFLHSYYFDANEDECVIAEAEYGARFPCGIHADNIYGVQFHPEKSHGWGMRLLQNFAGLAGC